MGHQRAGESAADARDLSLRHARRGEHAAVGDLRLRREVEEARVKVKAERFKDQTVNVATKPQRAVVGAGRGGGGGAGGPQTPPRPQEWLHDGSDKIYFTRLSRDMHASTSASPTPRPARSSRSIEERLNTYIESKPLRLVDNGTELIYWSERDGWGHYYLYDAATGALKNRITDGRVRQRRRSRASTRRRASLYLTAAGREEGEDPYYTHLYRVGLDGSGHEAARPGDASHVGDRSPTRARYFVDNSSRVDARAGVRRSTTRSATPSTKLETPDLTRAEGGGLQVPRAVHGEGRRWR